MDQNSGISLKVVENEINDDGRNIVRIHPTVMAMLNISEGDMVNIIGKLNAINIICISLLPSDKKKKIIRMDFTARDLIGVRIGDLVIIKNGDTIDTGDNKANKLKVIEVSDKKNSNLITISGSCIDFNEERSKIMNYLKTLENEVHSDNNYCKCYSNGKKTLGWDFFEISIDFELVKKLIEIHPEISKQEANTLEQRFVFWIYEKMKDRKLDYFLKINDVPHESVKGFSFNPDHYRDVDDMESMR